MAVEITTPGPADDGIVDAEVIEQTRLDLLKEKAAPHTAKAKAAFADQKARVAVRVSDWFKTADVTDEHLAAEIEKKRRQESKEELGEARARLARLRSQARTPELPKDAAAALAVQIAGAEVQLQMLDADHMKISGRDLSKARWAKKAGRLGAVVAGTYGMVNGIAMEPLLALAALGIGGPVGWWYLAHEDTATKPPVDLVKPGIPVQLQETAGDASPYGPNLAEPRFDAPAPPALDEEVLTEALRRATVIKPDATVKVLSAPAWGEDGTATTVFDLPAGVTVTALVKKSEAFAGALGRDLSMIDITKAGTASRASLWMSDADPFADARPSPLMDHKGSVDAWKDGIPVAWAKRGNAIALPLKNSSFVIAGMTRSGKGVGAANLVAGAGMDTRINLRVVAGKSNGEWDPAAKAGVAATYFKPNPARLLALLQALKADMDRRNRILGDLGKSKVVPECINAVGGLELLVIDELATFTRPDRPMRDEILEALIELSAVAAGAGILLVLITQYPSVDVIPQALAMNCGTRWAMRVDNATQSNAILGGGASSSGRDASKFDPPLPGLGWLVNPFAGVTDLARSFDLDEDERGEVTELMGRAARLRTDAGRLTGQWDDPIEAYLRKVTGLSSAAGGPDRNGMPGRDLVTMTAAQKAAREALVDAIDVMDELDRDAQLEEMAAAIGRGMTADRLGELLRQAGAGPTGKITIPDRGRVQGYRREALKALLERLDGA
ncbi:hypothetical protein [Streptomyces sp. OR43]|uniref:hypothetical protein n=1 Tax=Streptomyces sp. or43 TaxID=2478957 RepID=UPI0011CD6A10|nr:hypothetical protein [Streptomyces sp. or43]TXS34155.1 hypothetical protein EAO72_41435 [Streptomyces sp. or43]